MSKITKAWLDSQIEQELERGCCANAVHDLAALMTVRDGLCGTEKYDMHGKASDSRSEARLSKDDALAWVESMKAADGTHGGKWKHMSETDPLADHAGLSSEKQRIEFFAIVNAMYSDYCMVARKHGVDTPSFYADMARAWILDEDAQDGKAEKYYEYIVKK